MFAAIRATLERFRVQMDVYTNEVDLHRRAASSARSSAPAPAGHLFEQDGATWLRASALRRRQGSRVLAKSDGSPTYFAGDLAYLVDKLERGFDLAIYVLGADHHGYSARLRAAAQALGYDPARIEIPIYQMVHLIEDGEQKRMSKRRGDVVLLDELMDGIGVDAARFYLVQRSHDETIDIDLAQAVEQSPENPVYYVQYAHARICSILRRAGDARDGGRPTTQRPGAERGRARARARRLPRRLPRGRRAARAAPHRRLRPRPGLRRSTPSTATAPCSTPMRPSARRPASRSADATRQVLARSLDLLGVSAPEEM